MRTDTLTVSPARNAGSGVLRICFASMEAMVGTTSLMIPLAPSTTAAIRRFYHRRVGRARSLPQNGPTSGYNPPPPGSEGGHDLLDRAPRPQAPIRCQTAGGGGRR